MKTKLSRIIGATFVAGVVFAGFFFLREKNAALAPKLGSAALNAEIQTKKTPSAQISSILDSNNNKVVAPELLMTTAARWKKPVAEETFARFHDWSEQYFAANPSERSAMLPSGITLAETRRSELAALIKSNPERALELSVPKSVRDALPAEVRGLLEQRVAARGDLQVIAALAEPGKENEVIPTWRLAQVGGKEYKAFVYGRRLGEPTRNNIPLNGIAVNNLLAVNESPVRVLEPEEAAAAKSVAGEVICSVSGLDTTVIKQEVAVEVGDETVFVCRAGHIQALSDRLTQAESGAPGATTTDASTPEASAWTEGQKSLIVIRVDFPDLTNAPFSDTAGTNLVTGLNSFYTEMSYGRAGFKLLGAGSELTPIFRMPQNASYYGTNDYYNQLRADARAAATAAGYILTNYNLDVTCMGAVPGFGWAGLAYVGAAGAWIRNTSSVGVTGHELGHNYGLNHANYWDTTGASVTGPGTSVEYGDVFDTMGSASAGNNHFNARYKNYLNWLTTNEVVAATSNGVYRITAHDDVTATGIRGLRVAKNASTNYWVEFRQKFTSNKWLMNGAGLRWAQSSNQKSHLLDFTPGSTDGKNDSAIVIGRTFSDLQAGVHITPIGKGGTVPESLDVMVNLGSFPTNVPPTAIVLAAVTNAAVGATLNFSVDATDANGDALAYYWDFGDGNFGTNGATASKSWGSAGEYVVRCTVTDMKGGTASDSIIVTVGSPTTYRISGQILSETLLPVPNVRVFVSSTRMAYTDSDGGYTLVGLPAGTYTVSPSLENYLFATNFVNPVSVGPNKTGIDFTATFTTNSPPLITTQPVGQVVNPGATVTFSVVATGTAPMTYQWRINGTNIVGATSSSYTKSNVQATNAGNYSVFISNLVGTATSSTATLVVNSPPSISTPPQSQMAAAGSNVTFTVGVSGTAPFVYQWRFNATNIVGANAASLVRTNVQASDAGNYTVVVTNSLGSVTSAPAVLTVGFSLSATATYGGTVSKTPDLPLYTSGTVVTLNATPVSVFPFGGWAGDASGTNNPLTVVMNANKSIVANFISPVADLIVDNPSAVFSGTWATATSASDKYGSDYRTVSTSASSTSATATFTPNIAVAGNYDVYVWFPTITKGLTAAQFSVSDLAGVTNIAVDQTVSSGGWELLATGRNFEQGTNGFVRIGNMGGGGKTVVADAVRFVYSENQTATPPPVIVAQPVSQTVTQNASVAFSVGVSGAAPFDYQWLFNSTNLLGATNSSLMLPSAQSSQAGAYSVRISNVGGAVTSVVATLTVLIPPGISQQPVSQSVIVGASTNFNVVATGTAPLSYQWLFQGTNLVGATNAVLNIVSAQVNQAGNYNVKITNSAGAITSSVVTLGVILPAQIVAQPTNEAVTCGRSASFSVIATGTAPVVYTWRKDGIILTNNAHFAGANSNTLLIPVTEDADAGAYSVTVQNSANSTNSIGAMLTIVPVVPFEIRSVAKATNGQIQLSFTGNPGDIFQIESSTSLPEWLPLVTLTNVNGTIDFSAPIPTNVPMRLYRGRMVP